MSSNAFISGDAPPRGFCNKSHEWCTNQIIHDIIGPQADEVLQKFHERCITYNLLKLSKKQDVMVKKFKEMGFKNIFKVHPMTKSLNFDTVADTIIESVKSKLQNTNRHIKYNTNGQSDPCSVI